MTSDSQPDEEFRTRTSSGKISGRTYRLSECSFLSICHHDSRHWLHSPSVSHHIISTRRERPKYLSCILNSCRRPAQNSSSKLGSCHHTHACNAANKWSAGIVCTQPGCLETTNRWQYGHTRRHKPVSFQSKFLNRRCCHHRVLNVAAQWVTWLMLRRKRTGTC